MSELNVLKCNDVFDVPIYYTGIAEFTSGKRWYRNGKRHREDGPAVEWADGRKEWWQNGGLYRADGPAIESPDGTKHWFLNGKHFYSNAFSLFLKDNYVVLERGIPTDIMFGKLKLTNAKLLTSQGIVYQFDNLPGFTIGEGNE